jgi:hypothetical protein
MGVSRSYDLHRAPHLAMLHPLCPYQRGLAIHAKQINLCMASTVYMHVGGFMIHAVDHDSDSIRAKHCDHDAN